MSEQFCLRWNNHQSTLISVFENLLESESLIDCTLCAEGQILKAHKVVLSACSPTFETMLCIQEEKHPIIFLKDVRFIELKAMIDYMYKGEVNILQDQLDSFLKTAAALQIKGLTDQGGGGGDEPPAKKGPGRKTGMSDVAPESPLVGNAPLREGSMSPTRRRRRLPRRPSSAEDGSADNSSCDIPPPAVAAPPSVAAQPAPLPASEPSPRLTVKKQEPLDPPLITPKQEQLDEPAEDIEDLTLDDDDDYNDAMSEMSKPGTSFGAMGPGNTSQDFSQWQQMMSGNQAGTDEVFMAAQEAINNQTNTQGKVKRTREEKEKRKINKEKTPENVATPAKISNVDSVFKKPLTEASKVLLKHDRKDGKTLGKDSDSRKHHKHKHRHDSKRRREKKLELIAKDASSKHSGVKFDIPPYEPSPKIDVPAPIYEPSPKSDVVLPGYDPSTKADIVAPSYEPSLKTDAPALPYQPSPKTETLAEAPTVVYEPTVPTPVVVGEGETFQCQFCPKSYNKKELLKRHTRYECGLDPQPRDETSCPHCPYKAADKQALKNHIGIKHYVPW